MLPWMTIQRQPKPPDGIVWSGSQVVKRTPVVRDQISRIKALEERQCIIAR